MIRDEDLHSSIDYSGGQREAAHRVLVELCSLFAQYQDDIRIIGGWVPELLFPDQGHVGSVDVDILAGMYGGTTNQKRSQHVQGLKAMKATGGDFAFNFEPLQVKLEAKRPDGAIDTARVNVVALVPYLVMKTAAMGRGKAKDAYDIHFLITHYPGGTKQLALEFSGSSETFIVREMREKLSEKFASVDHAGPADVASFMDVSDEQEIDMIRRDAFEQVQALLSSI